MTPVLKQVPRWCKLTKTEFKYFKNHWSANCWLNKPMLSAPLTTIVKINKVRPAPKKGPKHIFELHFNQQPVIERKSVIQ
jgi:hypothetical protein